MAHLGASYNSFELFLGRADAVWTVSLGALNSSGVSATAILATATEEDGTQYLNIAVTAEGLTPEVQHAQHIHGLFDGDGAPIDSVSPTLANDADGDGIVEVLEGVPNYGDVLLPLALSDDSFLEADAMGQVSYFRAFDLADDSAFLSPVTGTQYSSDDIMPLALREIVLHGMNVPTGLGSGTGGEVDGSQDGYVPILPVAAGEIEASSVAQALALLESQRDVVSDRFTFGGGDDLADGGTGDDTMTGNGGNDTLRGGADSDVIDGGAGDDRLDAGVADGNRVNAADNGASGALRIGQYDNAIAGGAGDDLIVGRAGDDILTGDDDSRVSAVAGTVFDASADGSDTIYGGAGNDEIHTGSWSDSDQGLPNAQTGVVGDMARGGDGNDILRGAGGDDRLYGDAGDDNIGGGGGADLMVGGEGSDTFLVNDLGDMVGESRNWSGTDTVISSVNFSMGRQHIENLVLTGEGDINGTGNGLMNTITGNDGNNRLDGGRNNDVLIGGMGDDTYYVRAPQDIVIEEMGAGTDTVFGFRSTALAENVENLFLQTTAALNGIGNAEGNLIIGNMADNVLIGRGGNDVLQGQGGADSFVFDRAISADNVDTISDFAAGEDMIVLRASIFDGLETGMLKAGQFVTGTMAADADDRIVYDTTSGSVWYDADGVGGGDAMLFASIGNGAMLSADDFMIV